MQKLVSLHDASFGYSTTKNSPPIVRHVTFTVHCGDFILLVGPNGCGKSTIIRGLFDLVPRLSGTIDWSIPQNAIGYIPQESQIDHDIPATALDIVCSAHPHNWGSVKRQGMEMLSLVGMEAHAHRRFGMLSGGQKRRVLLARTLLGGPKLLVLDEPTVNTDRETEKKMESLLVEFCSKGEVGILATTHSENWASDARRYHVERGLLHG